MNCEIYLFTCMLACVYLCVSEAMFQPKNDWWDSQMKQIIRLDSKNFKMDEPPSILRLKTICLQNQNKFIPEKKLGFDHILNHFLQLGMLHTLYPNLHPDRIVCQITFKCSAKLLCNQKSS